MVSSKIWSVTTIGPYLPEKISAASSLERWWFLSRLLMYAIKKLVSSRTAIYSPYRYLSCSSLRFSVPGPKSMASSSRKERTGFACARLRSSHKRIALFMAVPMLMPSRVASAFISRYSWLSMIVFLCSILVTRTLLLHYLPNNISCLM